MRLGIHEACELNERLMSCTNSIHSMALFANQAQDPELKDMILRHFSVHVQDYNMKVEFATQTTGSQDHLNVPPLQMLPMGTPMAIQPVQPQVQLTQLDDRAIATSYLLTLKRSGEIMLGPRLNARFLSSVLSWKTLSGYVLTNLLKYGLIWSKRTGTQPFQHLPTQ